MSDEITHQFPQDDIRMHLTQLDTRVSLVEDQLERKLMETQPIWSQFLNEMAFVRTQLGSMDLAFEKIDGRFDQIDLRFDGVDRRFDKVDSRLNGVESRLGGVEARLETVETRLETVENRLEKVETGLEKVETRLEKVETRLGKVEYELYGLGKKFRVLNREILDIQNAHEDLEERVSFIENSSNQQ